MPGRCPSCNQVYTDETLSFCPNDGTALNREAYPAYPQPPGMDPAQQYPPPPPPQGYYPGAQAGGGQAPPPPPPGWQQQPPPYGQQQQGYQPQYGAPGGGGGKSKLPIIIAALALVLIGAGVGLYFLLRDNSSSTSNTSTNNSNRTDVRVEPPRSPTTTTTLPTPTTSTPTTTTTTTTGSYTEDQKHRLFQAVGMTGDDELIFEVAQKIGLVDSSGRQMPNFETFTKEHYSWAERNLAWVQEHLDPAKARAYVMANK